MKEKQVLREQVIDQVLSARTPPECEKAKALILSWMQSHPDDFGMLDAGEQVAMILDGYAHDASVPQHAA